MESYCIRPESFSSPYLQVTVAIFPSLNVLKYVDLPFNIYCGLRNSPITNELPTQQLITNTSEKILLFG